MKQAVLFIFLVQLVQYLNTFDLKPMPKVVLNYFPVKCLGEGIRMMLAYAGQEFEDNRISMDKWPEYRHKTKFGQMPVLEIDGKQYSQSVAISRYLGHRFGLAGNNIEEDFAIDENMDFFNDIRSKAYVVHREKDPVLKAKRHEENCKTVYPPLLKQMDQIIKENKGHLALGRLTWADFFFAGIFDYMKYILQDPDLGVKYPSFQKLVDNVLANPSVKAFVDASPKGSAY